MGAEIRPVPTQAAPRGRYVGIADEYGTIWDGEPGAEGSSVIGDITARSDGETLNVYIESRLEEGVDETIAVIFESLERHRPSSYLGRRAIIRRLFEAKGHELADALRLSNGDLPVTNDPQTA